MLIQADQQILRHDATNRAVGIPKMLPAEFGSAARLRRAAPDLPDKVEEWFRSISGSDLYTFHDMISAQTLPAGHK